VHQVIGDLDKAIAQVRAQITHPMGHQELKRALYFPAMVAARYNPLVTVFWNRLMKAQNNPGKVIVGWPACTSCWPLPMAC
jgi:hypothetical protein